MHRSDEDIQLARRLNDPGQEQLPGPWEPRAAFTAIAESYAGGQPLQADSDQFESFGTGSADRPAGRPPGADHQASRAPHIASRVYTAALDAEVPLRDVQEARSHAECRTTMRYDRARTSLDRHATYIVAPYVAGAAR